MMSAKTAIPASSPPRNALRSALSEKRFFWSIEFIPSVDKVLRDELRKLGGVAEVMRIDPNLAAFAVTDRVVSDRDPDPIAAASHLLDASGKQPLVHFSGKGRDISDLPAALARIQENVLENVLFLTGDKLRETPRHGRARYLESVPAIQAARRAGPQLLIAAALNPFKYREEDAMAQYLKLGKKVGAGADFVITQIGWDMAKYEEALEWVRTRNYGVPLVANVMPVSAQRARYMRHHQLAGVTVTDSFLGLLEAEERIMADKGAARVLRRLALQIIGLRLMGYGGVQLTGIHAPEKLAALDRQITQLSEICLDTLLWRKAWDESLTLPEGGSANLAPPHDPWYVGKHRTRRADAGQMFHYRLMRGVHDAIFGDGIGARVIAPLLRPVQRRSRFGRVLEKLERATKRPLFGCDTCGMCRLAATQYVCPETCPKGLANGACGGTSDNLCEFRDRECIHSVKYRIASTAGKLHELETLLIPAVPATVRHTSSWPAHYRGEGPQVQVIQFYPPNPEGKTG